LDWPWLTSNLGRNQNMTEQEKIEVKNPYTSSSGPSKLINSFVLYADILGYSELSKQAIKDGRGEEFLNRLRNALTTAYTMVRTRSAGHRGPDSFAVKVFTDNIVIGYPLRDVKWDLGEPEFGHILSMFEEYQARLAMDGFFIRGGITYGSHYMDDDIVFGDALLEAVSLDKGGGAPRLSLAPSALELVRGQLSFYGGQVPATPHYHDLLQDADDVIFLNYLSEAFIDWPEGGILFEIFEQHKKTVIEGLTKYKAFPGIRAKYEWAARYQNFVCEEFAKRYPSEPTADDIDGYYAVQCEEAQKLLEYIIDIESLAAHPSRMTITAIPLDEIRKKY